MPNIRVLIADDDAGLRDALSDTLRSAASESGVAIEVVGSAGDVATAERLACELEPDVVLLDVRMPGGGGRRAAEAIMACHPAARIVALSAYEDQSAVLDMLGAGAVSYLVKGSPELEIVDAIRRAARGQLSMAGDLGRAVVVDLQKELADSRRSEAALNRSESRLNALLMAAPDAMLMIDADGVIEFANTQVERLFGYQPHELTGQKVEVLLPDRFRTTHVGQRSGYFAGPRPRPMEAGLDLFGRRQDGTEFPVDISLSPLHTDEGLKVVAAIRNVAERRESELAHRKSEQRFRDLLESAPDAMVIVDQRGVIQLVNAQTERLFGYGRAELLGTSLDNLLPERFRGMHGRHRARYFGEPRPRAMGAGLELFGRRKDGSEFPVDISLSPIDTDEGRLVVAAVRDVSDRKQAERELSRTFEVAERQRMFAQLVRVQEEERLKIASDIHDDTIQAMTAASLRLQQLRRHLDRPADLELLGKLESAVHESIVRLRRLMFDLRPPALDRSGLGAALRDLLDRMQEETGIEATLGGDLALDLPTEARTTLYRIAQEALVNVRKHAQARHLTVELAALEDGCRVRVIDDGVGIESEAAMERPGHLGLVAMQERARMAGGRWRIERRPDGGTLVEFWIPLQTGGDAPGAPPRTE